MDTRVIRSFIYLFSGLIVVFSLLMLVNYIGSLTGVPPGLTGQAEEPEAPESAAVMAQQALAVAKAGSIRSSLIPAFRQGLSTAPVTSSGGIMVVKDKSFGGVAEKPQDMMGMLSEMAGGGKQKPSPIHLSDSDLSKKVRNLGGEQEQGLKTSSMPELGRGAGQEGVTLLSAPVDYKIFKSSATWDVFTASRKLKPVAHDFSAADLLILVSISDFPSGIFGVAGVEPGKKETIVKYRVNPLAMASETSEAERGAYASVPVPKNRPVRLQQVP